MTKLLSVMCLLQCSSRGYTVSNIIVLVPVSCDVFQTDGMVQLNCDTAGGPPAQVPYCEGIEVVSAADTAPAAAPMLLKEGPDPGSKSFQL